MLVCCLQPLVECCGFVASASVMVAADFAILEQLGYVACWLLSPHCFLDRSDLRYTFPRIRYFAELSKVPGS